MHWNGTRWARTPLPRLPEGSGGPQLSGVAATSARNAWAVGDYEAKPAVRSLALHWNGRTWSRVPTPNPGGRNGSQLVSVSALSPTDAWAVGWYNNGSANLSYILRWDGTAWHRVPGYSSGVSSQTVQLFSVTARTAGDAWAAGYYFDPNSGTSTLLLHWNGKAWHRIASPSPPTVFLNLDNVTADSAGDAWAVGNFGNGTIFDNLALHWNGSSWSEVTVPPSTPTTDSNLAGVAAASPGNAWAVGSYTHDTMFLPLVLHWSGTA